MAKKERYSLGYRSSLPYARVHGKEPTKKNASSVQTSFDSESPRPTFHIRGLVGRPILRWPIRLPAKDPRGLATGKDFTCWKKARDGRTGISGNWYSIKGSRMQPCHSFLEAKLRAFFDMSPFVLECRTQYPSWNRDEYERYYYTGRPFPANKVMTIDFMLTLAIPGLPYIVYHGVSGKPEELLQEEKTLARHERESSALWTWGGTHEVMNEYSVSDLEYANYLLLKSWFLWTDIESHMRDAFTLANALKTTRAQGSLDRILSMVGKRNGYSRQSSYRLFAVAVFLGYLWIDHRFPLCPEEPLLLLADVQA